MFIFTIRTINNSVFFYIVILLNVFQLQVNISSAIEPRLSKVPINSHIIKTINITKLININTTELQPPPSLPSPSPSLPPQSQSRQQTRQSFSIDKIGGIKSTNYIKRLWQHRRRSIFPSEALQELPSQFNSQTINSTLLKIPFPIIFNNRTESLGRALDENNHIESDITTTKTTSIPPQIVSTISSSMKTKTTTRDGASRTNLIILPETDNKKSLISFTKRNANEVQASNLKNNQSPLNLHLNTNGRLSYLPAASDPVGKTAESNPNMAQLLPPAESLQPPLLILSSSLLPISMAPLYPLVTPPTTPAPPRSSPDLSSQASLSLEPLPLLPLSQATSTEPLQQQSMQLTQFSQAIPQQSSTQLPLSTELNSFPPIINLLNYQSPLSLNPSIGNATSYLPAASGPIPLITSETHMESSMLLKIPNLNKFLQTSDQLLDITKKPYKAPSDLYSFPPNTNVVYQPHPQVDHIWYTNNNMNTQNSDNISSYLPSPAGLIYETNSQSQIKPIGAYTNNQNMAQLLPPQPPSPTSPPLKTLPLPPQTPLPAQSHLPPPHSNNENVKIMIPALKNHKKEHEIIYNHPPGVLESDFFNHDTDTFDYSSEYYGHNFEEYYPSIINNDESFFTEDIFSPDIYISDVEYGPNKDYTINDYYQNNNNGRDRYGNHLIKKRSTKSNLEHNNENNSTEISGRDKKYSYIYLGQKLWYIPLGFSVFFALYLGYIVIFSAATHKPEIPTNLLFKRSVQNPSNNLDLERKLNDITEFVMKQINEFEIKNK